MIKLSIAVAGFSVVAAALLFVMYAFFRRGSGKSAYSLLFCAVLLAALATVQVFHMRYFRTWAFAPLNEPVYRLALFVIPASFYFFARWATQPSERFRPIYLLHLLPVVLLFVVPLKVSLPVLLLSGIGYLLWVAWFIFGLRSQFKQFLFEFLCFVVMWLTAVAMLAYGLLIPFMDDAFFHLFSANGIGLCLAMTLLVLIVNAATASSSAAPRSKGRTRSHHPPRP